MFGILLSGLQAQTTFTWTGNAGDFDWFNGANWQGGVAPDNNAPGNIIFSNSASHYVEYYEVNVNSLSFSGLTRLQELYSNSGGTILLGTGGLTYNPAQPVTSYIYDQIQLMGNQTWNIASGSLAISYNIFDSYSVYNSGTESWDYVRNTFTLEKTGAGSLMLYGSGSNDWHGDVKLTAGKIVIPDQYSNYYPPLGDGTLIFNGGTLEAQPTYYYGSGNSAYLYNNIVSKGLISTIGSDTEIHLGYNSEGYSTIQLDANTTITHQGRPLHFEGNITEQGGARSLTVTGPGMVVLQGDNSYTGGTTATNGLLIFAHYWAIPANYLNSSSAGKLTAGSNGYIGFGDSGYGNAEGNTLQADFIDQFDKPNTTGAIGFDTDPAAESANQFAGNIDLTGFAASARLGSATRAILSGTITPQGSDYRFGGGGGWLQVNSQLTGSRNVVVDSPAALPLTVRLNNTANDFTGSITATRSAVILADGVNPGSTLSLGTGGYIGAEEQNLTTPQQFIDRFATGTGGMIGFDSASGSRIISDNLNLGAFTGGVYLGTTIPGSTDDGAYDGLTLTGTITTGNGGTDPYRFGGYKGGLLIVASNLTGSAGVKIGDPSSPATFADFAGQQYSKVALTGNNSGLSGNVTLYGGELFVGLNSPSQDNVTTSLGTGKLIVQGMTLPSEWQESDGSSPTPQLSADYNTIIPNDVTLNTRLNIAEYSDLTLAGKISGSGSLYLREDASLTLNNDANDFTGGIYLGTESVLEVDADHATGSGPLSFGNGSYAEVHFNTSNPVVGGLSANSNDDYSYLYFNGPSSVFTINQSTDTTFHGSFYSEGGLRVVKSGTGDLRIQSGELYYTNGTAESSLPGSPEVGLQINQGTLTLGYNTYFSSSTPTVWVHGGTLALDNSSLYNPVVVDNGGRLAGSFAYFGYYNSETQQGITIGTGATLAPGLSSLPIGTLGFRHLELAAGGTYEWQINSASNPVAGVNHDLINIMGTAFNQGDTLVVSAGTTGSDRFTLKIISLTLAGTPGALSGFNPGQFYAWTLFSYDALSGFDPAKFYLDASQFASANNITLGVDGVFAVMDDAANQKILLTFTAVPEPSTYALMGFGLAATALAAWRRRRRA